MQVPAVTLLNWPGLQDLHGGFFVGVTKPLSQKHSSFTGSNEDPKGQGVQGAVFCAGLDETKGGTQVQACLPASKDDPNGHGVHTPFTIDPANPGGHDASNITELLIVQHKLAGTQSAGFDTRGPPDGITCISQVLTEEDKHLGAGHGMNVKESRPLKNLISKLVATGPAPVTFEIEKDITVSPAKARGTS